MSAVQDCNGLSKVSRRKCSHGRAKNVRLTGRVSVEARFQPRVPHSQHHTKKGRTRPHEMRRGSARLSTPLRQRTKIDAKAVMVQSGPSHSCLGTAIDAWRSVKMPSRKLIGTINAAVDAPANFGFDHVSAHHVKTGYAATKSKVATAPAYGRLHVCGELALMEAEMTDRSG